MHPFLFHFGNLAIPTYGVLTAAALLAALGVAVWQAQRLGLRGEKVWNLGLIAILAALFGSRLLLIATHFSTFRAHPFWVLGLTSISGAGIALGGAAIGIAAAVLYALAEGLPLPATADALAPAAALAFALNRIGAFCGGLAWGKPTTVPWGVTYRKIVAWLWYRTPLGIRLHPVQLYDAALSLAIFALLLAMGRRSVRARRGVADSEAADAGIASARPARAGETAGAWLFLYGVGRFFVEFFRGDETHWLGGFLTLPQILSVLAVLAGGALWLRRAPVADRAVAQTS
ncbi:MAG: prolipoprotein diacylglyceryl transferase family protein [Acidobacteriaceae bacterium]